MDHLIHTLVLITVMVPSYTVQHVCQELDFKGLNLVDKQCKELLAQSPENRYKAPPHMQPIQEGLASPNAVAEQASAVFILKSIIAVSQALLSDSKLSSPETVRSLEMVESHLTAITHCSPSSENPSNNPLPEKENTPPNQGSK